MPKRVEHLQPDDVYLLVDYANILRAGIAFTILIILWGIIL